VDAPIIANPAHGRTDHGTDVGLLERARGGDVSAFAGLVERHQQWVGVYLRSLTGDREAARDLTQDTFIRAYRAIGRAKPDLPIRPWLYRIATNLAHDRRRRQRLFQWLPLRLADGVLAADDLGAIEEQDVVQRTLLRLRPEERAVLLVCGVDRLHYEEAAAALGGSAESIRKRYSRAKARFRTVYAEVTGDATAPIGITP
jgi:RNA polymerase sigma-70 factor (ECF subfamily)